MKRIAIAGAGISGAVIAHELSKNGKYKIDVFEAANHVAGNCHSERDPETNIMVHVHGPHIFHTSNEKVWNFICQFDKFMPFTNRVKAVIHGKVFSLPINLLTINQFFGKNFSPAEAKCFLESVSDNSIKNPRNFEEQALRFVGRELYEAFFKGYTMKQWGTHPSELPATILKRIPIRFNYDDNYYNSLFQGMPRNGYTYIVKKMLDNNNITVHLRTKFERKMLKDYDHLFYSGALDDWFSHSEGRLGYRTLDFIAERSDGDYQGNAVINYGDLDVPWTRISEHKYFSPWELHDKTIIFKEYSRLCGDNDTPYYPIRLTREKAQLTHYMQLAKKEKKVTFIGRLGTYRYLDMHISISEALDTAAQYSDLDARGDAMPAFSVNLL